MRIVGVAIARNEEDVVEASVRHNLRHLDALLVVDHASTDATSGILASLAAEGLPIEVTRDDTLGALPASYEPALVRRALEGGADLVIPLGADEFIRLPSREAFERHVRGAGAPDRFLVPQQTFAPDFASDGDIATRLRHARRRTVEPTGAGRVASTRHASFDRTDAGSAGGRSAAGNSAPGAAVEASLAAIARVPVRSVEQHISRVAIGYLSRLLASPPVADDANPFRESYVEIVSGKAPSRDRLETVALNLDLPPGGRTASDPGKWIEDPFLAGIELRYTPAKPTTPLARVLAFGERVAHEIALTTGGL